jgi:hypothetical protein
MAPGARRPRAAYRLYGKLYDDFTYPV